MHYKTSLKIVGALAFIFLSVWSFNHINAWLGILLFIIGLIISLHILKNKTTE